MLFNQFEFIVFLAALLLGLRLCKGTSGKKLLLLAFSYYFYAYWDWRFLSLLLLSTIVDYLVGLGLEKGKKSSVRKGLITVSLTVNLGLLGFFKYFNFFIESFSRLIEPLGFHPATLNIILPVGISFYTFQTLSYSIDVYRGRLKPCRNFVDLALFVSFFPQLVAGPIVRASDFLPQLESLVGPSRVRFMSGGRQFLIGLFKKVFIADHLAAFVDGVFAAPTVFDGLTLLLAVFAFSLQIYFDFSGYSDMAIGTARVLGFDLKRNFNFPYLSASPRDFWRRWHISLSTWLRDYLYIPLGGNRRGRIRTDVNLMLTMLLGGLWHGAGWTYILWGAWHGMALVIQNHTLKRTRLNGLGLVVSRTATLLIVIVGWLLFRAENLPQAATILYRVISGATGVTWYSPFVLGAALTAALVHVLKSVGWFGPFRLRLAVWYTPAVLFCLLWLSIAFYPQEFQPFVYFQF